MCVGVIPRLRLFPCEEIVQHFYRIGIYLFVTSKFYDFQVSSC